MPINYYEYLLEKYGKLSLLPKEVAVEINVSQRKVVESCRSCSADIPQFKKTGRTYLFPINEVAKFLSDGFVKVM